MILHAISNIRHTVKYAVKVRFIVVVNRLYCENVLKLLIKADEAKADNILQQWECIYLRSNIEASKTALEYL